MSEWRTVKARRLLAALKRIGWSVKRQTGSHKVLSRPGWPDTIFAFHDNEEVGPRMLSRVAKVTGLKPEDLQNQARRM
ncbi:MAG: type II toxin-antitoxin system HicA family toxin [Anaerolineales bacterium]|nr:type II toxin-antitoxin system HicA family toxin [Chloroflexota bacterium]MDO9129799.1 type II toxin-antitoxin system HicA family toxin [Anaerolineales bacterium]MDO9348300.1 type II toxin-antitoxin system HicA family toxin [Anaerolineales bacterium]MDP2976641.1 type II toxin-antitoxin system HicA family toxin [Anaerolineales bacterium]MDP3184706.1 type II toxin-antitoxin system HicA family toxin [Anaerolineales bacterium]